MARVCVYVNVPCRVQVYGFKNELLAKYGQAGKVRQHMISGSHHPGHCMELADMLQDCAHGPAMPVWLVNPVVSAISQHSMPVVAVCPVCTRVVDWV